MKTSQGLVEYAKAQLGLPYWYGTFGNVASASLYKTKNNQYPKYYSKGNYKTGFSHQYGKRVHDCVGLIKGYLWSENATAAPKYNAKQDVSANGMLSKCIVKGKIETLPEIAGVLVFFSGHVGVYIGNGWVIEARGHDHGVVKTKLSDRPWTDWGKCPWITYSTNAPKPTKTIDELAREVIEGKWGDGTERKNRLTAEGHDYSAVQKRVNELISSSKPTKTVDELAREVTEGKWGDGTERKNRLTAEGHDYSAVQKRVNEIIHKI